MKPINFVLSQFPTPYLSMAQMMEFLISEDNFLSTFCFDFLPPKHEKLKRYQTSTSTSCGGEGGTPRATFKFLGKAITVENREK